MKKTLISTAVALVMLSSSLAHAGLDDALESTFGGMINVTEPQAFDTINSIGVYGGRIVNKNKIVSTNIANFSPPSLKGGCGGIDLFAGSFSFIDAEHLAKLGEAVISNAGSFAAYTVLKAALPGPFQLMQELQKKIQDMNAMLGNSCQLAKGLVNATGLPEALGQQEATENKTALNARGLVDDFFSGFNSGTTQSKAKTSMPDFVEQKTGNLIWKQIMRSDASFQYTETLSDGTVQISTESKGEEFLRSMMSLTGTVIVDPNTSSDGNTGSDQTSKVTVIEPTISLSDLVNGGSVSLITCTDGYGENQCLTIGSPTNVGIESFAVKILKELNGDGTNIGAIEKMATLTQGTLTDRQKQLVSSMPFLSGTALKSLSTKNIKAAKEFSIAISQSVALNMARDFAIQLFNNAEKSLSTNKSVYAPQASEVISRNRQRIENEYMALNNEYGSINDILEKYKGLIEFLQTTASVKKPKLIETVKLQDKPSN